MKNIEKYFEIFKKKSGYCESGFVKRFHILKLNVHICINIPEV